MEGVGTDGKLALERSKFKIYTEPQHRWEEMGNSENRG